MLACKNNELSPYTNVTVSRTLNIRKLPIRFCSRFTKWRTEHNFLCRKNTATVSLPRYGKPFPWRDKKTGADCRWASLRTSLCWWSNGTQSGSKTRIAGYLNRQSTGNGETRHPFLANGKRGLADINGCGRISWVVRETLLMKWPLAA